MRLFLVFTFFLSLPLAAQINLETHNFSFEYGLAYHTLRGTQRSNNTTGRLTTSQNPYWNASYAYRITSKFALQLYGGVQFIQFNEPKFGSLIAETRVLNNYGLEIMHKPGPNSKFGVFVMHQDHPLYFADSPTELRIVRGGFVQSGAHFQLSQRRRIGLLWGLGLKAFVLFPTEGGNIVTETGGGGEGYARLGWVGPLGALYQVKGFYQAATAPNAVVTFQHEVLGYCFMVSHSF
jgi:hypothetical protein